MKKLLLVLMVIYSSVASAQNFGINIGGGAMYYYGDMNDRVVTHEKLLRPYFTGGLLYRLSPRFDVWAGYMHGEVAGADSLAVKYALRNRNLSFKSAIDEVSVNIGFRILGDRKGSVRRVVPYLFAGVAGFHFSPKASFNGSMVDLQSIGTEGQYINEGNYPAPYELYQLAVPAGIGVEFALSRAFKLRIEAADHFIFTDYLDDLSTNYPDSASLAATPNGAVAVALSSNIIDADGFPAKDTRRGSARAYDSYVHVGAALLWTPLKAHSNSGQKKKKKKHNCPAYH